MNDLSDYFRAFANSAADLVLSFFGANVPSDAKRDGTKRRVQREDKLKEALKALHANAPVLPESRQCHRRIARRLPRWNWRDILEEAKGATS